jgi:hypothetical protein
MHSCICSTPEVARAELAIVEGFLGSVVPREQSEYVHSRAADGLVAWKLGVNYALFPAMAIGSCTGSGADEARAIGDVARGANINTTEAAREHWDFPGEMSAEGCGAMRNALVRSMSIA